MNPWEYNDCKKKLLGQEEEIYQKWFENIDKNKIKNYTPKHNDNLQKCNYKNSESLKFNCPVYTGTSKKYNLYKYVYGRLYAQLYEFGTCEIIEETGRIYSWSTYLLGLYNRKHILWFDIENVDKKRSKLTYVFNNKNRILEYEDYLYSIEYCIDRNT